MNSVCSECGGQSNFAHDHKADGTGLDDGPPYSISGVRKPPSRSWADGKTAGEITLMRKRAWETRRQKYGEHGHR